MSQTRKKDEYPVVKNAPKPVHGNTKTGLPFHSMEVGDAFEVPPWDYGRTNSARAHFKRKKRERENIEVEFSSTQVRDPSTGKLISYRFRREK